MTIFDRIRSTISKTIKALSLNDPKAWDRSLWNLYGNQSTAGEVVNEYTALNYSTFWRGVNIYAGAISTLPLHLMRKSGGRKVPAEAKNLYWVMYNQANPTMTAQVVRATMIAHVFTWGNAYAEIVRDGLVGVKELWPISPERVRPRLLDNRLVYEITVDGNIKVLPKERILHLHLLGFDGFTGYSLVGMARQGIGLSMALQTFGAQYFSNGTHPGMIIKHPGQLKEPARLREALMDSYAGLGQSHRMMLLEEGMTAESITIPPEDAQFLQSRQFQITEMAQWFGLPPHKLGDLSRSSFSNIEAENLSYYQDALLPVIVSIEQQYNMQLLTQGEQNQGGLFFRHNVDGILRADSTGRANLYRALFAIGAISPNDIREKEDMDPIADPMADEYYVPLNMVPMSMLKEQLEKKAAPPPAPPTPPEPDGTEPDDTQTEPTNGEDKTGSAQDRYFGG